MKFKLRQIAHALAVHRFGSFRRAAIDQHLSQPALSRSIHTLEEALGVPLFDRDTKNEVTLTSFGEAFISRAQNLVIEADELEREMSLMKGLGLGRFSVAIGLYAGATSGKRAVAELLRLHPALKARVELPNWRNVERLVRNRAVDIGFCEVAHLQDSPDLVTENVGRHEVVFFCRPGHPLLSRAGLTAAVLDEYPFAGVPIPFRLAALFPRNCNVDETTGDIYPPILVEDIPTNCEIVASTDAFGAAMPLHIEDKLKAGSLALVPLRAPYAAVHYGFIHLASRSLPPAAEAFKVLVKEIERGVAHRNQILIHKLFPSVKTKVSR